MVPALSLGRLVGRRLLRLGLSLAVFATLFVRVGSVAGADFSHFTVDWVGARWTHGGAQLSQALAFHRRNTPSHPVQVTFEWHPDRAEGIVLSQFPAGNTEMPAGQVIRFVANSSPPSARTSTVPAVVGMSRPQALAAIRDAGLVHHVRVDGLTGDTDAVQAVSAQSPAAGLRVLPGSRVSIDMAWVDRIEGRGGMDRRVPNVVGMTRAAASREIAAAGFTLESRIENVGDGELRVTSQTPAGGSSARRGAHVFIALRFDRPDTQVIRVLPPSVPNVMGVTRAEAQAEILRSGLVAEVVPTMVPAPADAVVVAQNPTPGTRTTRGATVRLTLGARAADGVEVPDLMGRRQVDVERLLRAGGFGGMYSGDFSGTVVSQYPAAGTRVRRGTPIRVNYSGRRSLPLEVPNVVGMDRPTAEATLRIAGLRATFTTAARNGPIMVQSPTGGSRLPPGSEVRLTVRGR